MCECRSRSLSAAHGSTSVKPCRRCMNWRSPSSTRNVHSRGVPNSSPHTLTCSRTWAGRKSPANGGHEPSPLKRHSPRTNSGTRSKSSSSLKRRNHQMNLFRKHPKTGPAPTEGKDLVLADLDGVVYRGALAVPGAVESLIRANETAQLGYITNNASKTVATVAETLRGFGLPADEHSVITSPQAAVKLLKNTVPPPATILIVGGDGIEEELVRAGYRVTRSADDEPAAVVQGFAPHLAWPDLAEAAFALQEGPNGEQIPWIATNTDWTLPLERGLAPGNGTLVSAVHTAVARLPEFAGKPETPIFETAFERFGTRNALMIGDRLDTDMQGANESGIESVHVLTGVDRPKQLLAAGQNMRPTYIVENLTKLFEPYPVTRVTNDGTVKVGRAKVRMNGHIVQVVAEGDDPLNLLRAGCEAIWRSGLAIYGLKVPDVLLIDHWRDAHRG